MKLQQLNYKNAIKNIKFDYTKQEQYRLSVYEKSFEPVGNPLRQIPRIYQIQDRYNNIYSLELDRNLDDIRYIEDVNGIRYYHCYRTIPFCAYCPKFNECYGTCVKYDEYISKKYPVIKDQPIQNYEGFLDKNRNQFYAIHYERKNIRANTGRCGFFGLTDDISALCVIVFLKDAAGLKKVVYKNGDTYYYLKDYKYILSKEYSNKIEYKKDKSLGWQWQVYQRAKNKLPIIRDANNKEYFYSKNRVNNDYLVDKKGKRYILVVKNCNFWLTYTLYAEMYYYDQDDNIYEFGYDYRFNNRNRDGYAYRKHRLNCFPVYNSTIFPIGYVMHKQWYKKNLRRKLKKIVLNNDVKGELHTSYDKLKKIYESSLYNL